MFWKFIFSVTKEFVLWMFLALDLVALLLKYISINDITYEFPVVIYIVLPIIGIILSSYKVYQSKIILETQTNENLILLNEWNKTRIIPKNKIHKSEEELWNIYKKEIFPEVMKKYAQSIRIDVKRKKLLLLMDRINILVIILYFINTVISSSYRMLIDNTLLISIIPIGLLIYVQIKSNIYKKELRPVDNDLLSIANDLEEFVNSLE